MFIDSFHSQIPSSLSVQFGIPAAEQLKPGYINGHEYSFSNSIKKCLDTVNHHEIRAQNLMTGMEADADNLVETVLAIQKANRSMQMLIQVRNRVVDSWRDIMNQSM